MLEYDTTLLDLIIRRLYNYDQREKMENDYSSIEKAREGLNNHTPPNWTPGELMGLYSDFMTSTFNDWVNKSGKFTKADTRLDPLALSYVSDDESEILNQVVHADAEFWMTLELKRERKTTGIAQRANVPRDTYEPFKSMVKLGYVKPDPAANFVTEHLIGIYRWAYQQDHR